MPQSDESCCSPLLILSKIFSKQHENKIIHKIYTQRVQNLYIQRQTHTSNPPFPAAPAAPPDAEANLVLFARKYRVLQLEHGRLPSHFVLRDRHLSHDAHSWILLFIMLFGMLLLLTMRR